MKLLCLALRIIHQTPRTLFSNDYPPYIHKVAMDSPITRTDSPMAIRQINSRYDPTDSEQSALRLIYTLFPEWNQSEGEVELVRFTDGITNTVRLRQAILVTHAMRVC